MLYLQLWLDIMSFMESAPESSSSSVNLKTRIQILLYVKKGPIFDVSFNALFKSTTKDQSMFFRVILDTIDAF